MAIIDLANLPNKTAAELIGTEQIFLNDSGVAKDVTVSEFSTKVGENVVADVAVQKDLAVAARTGAESARDAAIIQAGVYTTEALGRAAVADGVAFKVQGSGDVAAYEYRRTSSTTSVLIATYPSKAAYDSITAVIKGTPSSDPVLVTGITNPLAVLSAPGANGLLYNLLSVLPDGSLDSLLLDNFVSTKTGGLIYSTAMANGWGEFVYSKLGPDGLLYAVFGVLEDNTLYSGSVAPVLTYEETTTSDWGHVVYTMRGADGFSYALYGLLADNSFYTPKIILENFSDELIHIPLLGQSNMAADQATPILSSSSTGWGNYRFSRGVSTWSSADNPTTPASRANSGFRLVPLTASGVETRANGLADAYKARLVGATRYSAKDHTVAPHILVSFSGIGSRKLSDLGPEDSGATDVGNTHAAPGGYWPTMMDDIVRAKVAAADASLNYSVPCWIYDQGENEGDGKLYFTGPVLAASAVISGYTTLALEMVNAFDSTVRGITGQTRPIPLLVTPVCANMWTATAWQNVADQTDLCVLVGPRYQMPSAYNASSGTGGSQVWGDSVHHTADGQRWIGEMCAKVMHRLLNEGERWQPLRALSASIFDATTIDVVMNVPRPPMVIDTTLLVKCLGWGFSIYNGSIDAQTNRARPTAIELRPDGRTVRLTFSSIPSGAYLAIGADSLADIGITPTVASVGTGSNSVSGFATYTLTITGDIRAQLTPLTREGVFFCYGSAPSRGYIRSVALVGSDTVLTGEVRELRTDGSYTPFAPGNTLTFGRAVGFTNLRDSDNALALNTFTTDPRSGQLYPLHNWLCAYASLSIIGA